jgi:hypothetical protein
MSELDRLVRLVAARGHTVGRAEAPVSYESALELACGVTLPAMQVTIGPRLLLDGVTVAFTWAGQRLANVRIDSFFEYRPMTAKFRLQAAATGRRPAHLMMLLIDEIIYRIHRLHGLARGFVLELDDGFRKSRGETPFALYGRHLLQGGQDSRWLQWERGSAYYVTFGFWPMGEKPEEYAERMRWVARPGEVVGPDDTRYAHTLMELARETCPRQLKSMPPVLPGPRRFADMEAYYAEVLVPGTYGPLPVPVRPTAQQTARAATGALFAAIDRGDARAALAALVEGADTRREVDEWTDDEPDAALMAADRGLLAVLPAIQRARGGAGEDARPAKRARVAQPTDTWTMRDIESSDTQHTVAAGGHLFCVPDAEWLPPEVERLIEVGFAPEGVQPGELADSLRQVAACRAFGPVVRPDHPQFEACRQTAARIRAWLDRPWHRAAR